MDPINSVCVHGYVSVAPLDAALPDARRSLAVNGQGPCTRGRDNADGKAPSEGQALNTREHILNSRLWATVLQFLPTEKLSGYLVQNSSLLADGSPAVAVLESRFSDVARFVLRQLSNKLAPVQEALEIPAFLNPMMAAFRSPLRSLDISNFQITSKNFRIVLDLFPNLREIDLERNYSVGNADIEHLAKRYPHLQTIKFSNGLALTGGAAFVSLATWCPNLECVDLSFCTDFNDEGLDALGATCSKLRVLSLAHCIHLTDVGFGAIAAHCPNLESLDLSYCVRLTDVGILSIVKHCPKLTQLDLTGCHITDTQIRVIEEGLVSCRVVR